jgi:hypothetical protein
MYKKLQSKYMHLKNSEHLTSVQMEYIIQV